MRAQLVQIQVFLSMRLLRLLNVIFQQPKIRRALERHSPLQFLDSPSFMQLRDVKLHHTFTFEYVQPLQLRDALFGP